VEADMELAITAAVPPFDTIRRGRESLRLALADLRDDGEDTHLLRE